MLTDDELIQHLLKLLVDRRLIDTAQARDIRVKAPTNAARITARRRTETSRLTGKKLTTYRPWAGEILASFQLSDRRNPAGVIDEEVIARLTAEDRGLPFLKIDPLKLDVSFSTQIFPGPFAEKHQILALERDANGIKIAMVNPYDTEVIENLTRTTGTSIQPVVTPRPDLEALIIEFYGFRRSVSAAESDLTDGNDLGNLEQYVKMKAIGEIDASDKPVVNAVSYLLHYAFEQRASDIHIEPKREFSQVRLRIDGVLHDIHKLPKLVHAAVVSRIKTMGRMDIAEKRRPQDGRIKTNHRDKEIELRVSTLPVAFGEKVVIRIFDPDVLFQDFDGLGLFPEERGKFEAFLNRPHGILLVTGPTGSGKTTTLYSGLQYIASSEVNITTIEDPIEMVHEAFNQVQVQQKIGVSFAAALRTILRQDPDVIMVGEIRDLPTAENAIQAAMTGHLVLSTLHTNDTASSVARLVDLGILPFQVSSTVIGIVAQRLVRMICPKCIAETFLSEDQMRSLQIPRTDKQLPVKFGKGCTHCRGTGYYSRTGIFEMMEMTPNIIRMINNKDDAKTLKREAVSDGMLTLREAAIRKMAMGVTTFEEVVRITSEA